MQVTPKSGIFYFFSVLVTLLVVVHRMQPTQKPVYATVTPTSVTAVTPQEEAYTEVKSEMQKIKEKAHLGELDTLLDFYTNSSTIVKAEGDTKMRKVKPATTHPGFYLLPLVPDDGKNAPYWNSLLDTEGSVVTYDQENNVLVMRNDHSFTPVWQAFLTYHQMFLAYAQQRNPYKTSDQLAYCERAENAFTQFNKWTEGYAGNAYTVCLEREKERQALLIKRHSYDIETFPGRGSYDTQLDAVFGKANSTLEQDSRTTFLWIDAVFHCIDSRQLPPTENVQLKRNLIGAITHPQTIASTR